MAEQSTDIQAIVMRCGRCGVVWKKHLKKIEYEERVGGQTVKLSRWARSKEKPHECVQKPESIRKDWE